MPRWFFICNFEGAKAERNSSGRTNIGHWWVPSGRMRSRYSAPTIAIKKLTYVRSIVETNNIPPCARRAAEAVKNAGTSLTCSTTSSASTTSKSFSGESTLAGLLCPDQNAKRFVRLRSQAVRRSQRARAALVHGYPTKLHSGG